MDRVDLNEWMEIKRFAGHLRYPVRQCDARRCLQCSGCDHHKALPPLVDLRPSRPRSMAVRFNAVMSAVSNDVLEQVNTAPHTYDGPLAQRDSREIKQHLIG